MEIDSFNLIAYVWLATALVVHVVMFYVKAPFGRHTSEKWGPSINNKLAWVLMELPSLSIMGYFLFSGNRSFDSYVWILFACWMLHYVNRTIIYPLRIRPTEKRMPLVIAASGAFFNITNASLNGYYLSELAPVESYGKDWLFSGSFLVGALMFVAGMLINMKSDTLLIQLRKPGETGYKIPRGFLFQYISSPNLFGEIVEWSGFALMAYNLPALTFAVWTFANLVPRAKNHHDWYLEHFAEYPKERKVVFPFLY